MQGNIRTIYGGYVPYTAIAYGLLRAVKFEVQHMGQYTRLYVATVYRVLRVVKFEAQHTAPTYETILDIHVVCQGMATVYSGEYLCIYN